MYLEAWRALSARARGVAEAGNLFAQFLQANNQDTYGVYRDLGSACAEILADLVSFEAAHSSDLPVAAARRIGEFFLIRKPLFEKARQDGPSAKAALVLLLGLVADLDYHLRDEQVVIRSRTERAFNHLQRILATDPAQRTLWESAFNGPGEVACEALGGAHLLWHGIYGFKANATGARTDLIFSNPPATTELETTVDGIVLTEWKVSQPHEGAGKFALAKTQAAQYAAGALSTLELSSFRYLVVVSLKHLPRSDIPGDIRETGTIYRHINLVIDPDTPSKAAARLTTK